MTGVFSGNNTLHNSSHFPGAAANDTVGKADLGATGAQSLPDEIHTTQVLKNQLEKSQESLNDFQEQLKTFRTKNRHQLLVQMIEKLCLKNNLCEVHKNLSKA